MVEIWQSRARVLWELRVLDGQSGGSKIMLALVDYGGPSPEVYLCKYGSFDTCHDVRLLMNYFFLKVPSDCLYLHWVTGDALHNLRINLEDPNNVLQSWDPTLVNPCTWFHVTCNNDNSVIRVDLGNAALSGQLVSQLGLLKNLQYL
ncbi:unnamed protein product [Thlaspi arvense]|uniref:Leucine-rich repeat-containing N-terminal plant-type domain-containing protein n=1 Tax=Thlaspi arvense TaxID=13288 RepID=A0AAU9S787_THLAR|nr:unnamed protein product [Thlaspi arvense]